MRLPRCGVSCSEMRAETLSYGTKTEGDEEAMTRQYLLWNLREAAEAISDAISEIQADTNCSEAELQITRCTSTIT